MSQKFNKADFHYYGLWKQPLISAYFWIEWYISPALIELHPEFEKHPTPYVYLDGHFWVKQSDMDFINQIVRSELTDDALIQKYTERLENVLKKYEKLHLSLLSKRSLTNSEYLEQLFETFNSIAGLWTWITFMGECVEKMIVEQHIVPEDKLFEEVELVKPLTWLEEQSKEITAFADQIRKLKLSELTQEDLDDHKKLKKKLEDHVRKFEWFGTHHWRGDGYTLNDCLQQINERVQKKDNNTPQKKIKSTHPLIILMAVAAYWRTHCAEVSAKVIFSSRHILKKIAALQNISYENLINLSPEEILQAATEKNPNLKSRAAEREMGFGVILDNEKTRIITGNELRTLLSQLLDITEENVKQFKGNVACRGPIIKGIAKVILEPKDFQKLNDNEILVAAETSPDYVPLMKRAGAIITDKGGITSHAAIVSRELKKPCIIGTKIATKVLKDGDLVEVDAEKGIVKILK